MQSTRPDDSKGRCHQCHKPSPTTDKEVVGLLREWVGKGEAWAQRMMAQQYRGGGSGVKQSYVMARMLFEKAVAQGDPAAMYCLALLYGTGRGVAQSFEKEAELYTMAAEQGYADAMFWLAVLYKKGQGVPQSNKTAREWFTKSRDAGGEDASEELIKLDEEEGELAAIEKAVEQDL